MRIESLRTNRRCAIALWALATLAGCGSDGASATIEREPVEEDAREPGLDASALDASARNDRLDASRAPLSDAASAPSLSDASVAPARRARPISGGRVTGDVTGGNGTVLAASGPSDLTAHGYVQSEVFLEGEATAYASQGERGIDGHWRTSENGKASYKTRLVVRRPARAADFNGTVMVEWLNVTTNKDAAVAFSFAWEELLRGGYGYVGVSVQQVGTDALIAADDARYGAIEHPSDAYAYDIFSQAGAAIGWPGEHDPFAGLQVRRLIGYGQSQSAMRMVTYVNAVHPLVDVYDGFMIQSRAGWGAPVGTESNGFLGEGTPVHVRSDTSARVLQFSTETELFFPVCGTYAARQPDDAHVISWEVAGTAHADQRLVGSEPSAICGVGNAGPQHYVVKAALRSMHRWLTQGTVPASGQALRVNAAMNDIERDAHGKALGGIRSPAVDVPIATLSGEPGPGNELNPLCLLGGHTLPFSAEELGALYPTHAAYVDQVARSVRAMVEAGFALPEDEQTVIAEAMAAAVP